MKFLVLFLKGVIFVGTIKLLKGVGSVIGEPIFWAIFLGLVVFGCIGALLEHKKRSEDYGYCFKLQAPPMT